MIFNVNWTEIVNLAGKMHNKSMQGAINEEEQNETADKILKELGLDTSELLYKIGCIESAFDELCNGQPLDNYRKQVFEGSCFDLRYKITNVIGE
jgi:hypothetical protein